MRYDACSRFALLFLDAAAPDASPTDLTWMFNAPKADTEFCSYQPSRVLYLPFFHAAMVPVAHITPLRAGHVTYILRRFELEPFLSALQNFQPTELVFVPPVAVAVLKYPNLHNYSLKSIKVALSGAGPLDKEHQNALQAILGPDTTFTQVWGMTETSCIASKFVYPERDDTGSVGRMIPNLDVK